MARKVLVVGVRSCGASSLLDHRLREECKRTKLDCEILTTSPNNGLEKISTIIVHHEGWHGEESQRRGNACVAAVRGLRRHGFTGPIIVMSQVEFRPALLAAGATLWLASCSCRAPGVLCELLPQVWQETLA